MINYIIGAILILAVICALRVVRKNLKNGGCGCGCSGCSQSKTCASLHSSENNLTAKQDGKTHK